MERRFNATLNDPESYRPSYYYHAFELPEMPVITGHDPDLIQLFQWGLIPHWTDSEEKANTLRYQTFNARAETITQKPSFRRPVQSNRCIVPAAGFYEWQHQGKEKIPFYIYLKDQSVFSFAGIYDQWTNRTSGEITHTFSIITTRANDLMEKIHNSKKRMPAILAPDDELLWLDHQIHVREAIQLLKPFPDERMEAHTISRMISKKGIDKNTAELIQPVQYNQPGLF